MRLRILRDFLLISTGRFHDISVMIWRAHEINNLLLSPPKFRRTLIVYFQLIMQFFTETDTDVSAAQAERGGRLRK